MRLCRFDAGAGPRHGVIDDGYVVDRDDADERHPLEEVRLLAPVLPRKFLAIGLNYADHIAESGMEAPEFPVFFNKQITCVVGPDDDVHMPRVSKPARLRGRAGGRDRDALPPRAGGPRPRGDRRLHDHQRRLACATGRCARRR